MGELRRRSRYRAGSHATHDPYRRSPPARRGAHGGGETWGSSQLKRWSGRQESTVLSMLPITHRATLLDFAPKKQGVHYGRFAPKTQRSKHLGASDRFAETKIRRWRFRTHRPAAARVANARGAHPRGEDRRDSPSRSATRAFFWRRFGKRATHPHHTQPDDATTTLRRGRAPVGEGRRR